MHAIIENVGTDHSNDKVWETNFKIADIKKTTITYRHPTVNEDEDMDDVDEEMIAEEGGNADGDIPSQE